MSARTYHVVGVKFPLIFEKGKEGVYEGVGAEIVKQVSQELGIEITIRDYPLKRALYMVKTGQADVIIGPYKSKEREEYIDYSNFYFYEDPLYFYIRKGDIFDWQGEFKKLKGLKIGAINGWSLGDDFNDNKSKLDVLYVNKLEQLFSMLERKRLDIVIAHPRAISGVLKKEVFVAKFRNLKKPITINRGYFGFSKNKELDEFKLNFEKTYHKLEAQGSFRQFKPKY